MDVPGWVNKVIVMAVLAGVVLVATGVGRACAGLLRRWLAIVVAAVIGGACGVGGGMGACWWFPSPNPSTFTALLTSLWAFYGLVGPIQAGVTAAGARGKTSIGLGA